MFTFNTITSSLNSTFGTMSTAINTNLKTVGVELDEAFDLLAVAMNLGFSYSEVTKAQIDLVSFLLYEDVIKYDLASKKLVLLSSEAQCERAIQKYFKGR